MFISVTAKFLSDLAMSVNGGPRGEGRLSTTLKSSILLVHLRHQTYKLWPKSRKEANV